MRESHELVTGFSHCRVLVVGDVMLDEYRRGHVERISPEAPVAILRVTGSDKTLGGAGNVAKNLRALGANVEVVGLLGVDETGEAILQEIGALGVDEKGMVQDAERTSTRKLRYVSIEHGQQVFRADEETAGEATGEIEEQIIERVRARAAAADVILCSDYLKGVLTPKVLRAVFEAGRERNVPVIVAPKDRDAKKYAGANVLMPNAKELAQMVGIPVDGDRWLTDSAAHLTARLGLDALLVTRGKDGMTLLERTRGGLRRVDIPTAARNVYDVTGAGDTALATFAAGIAAGADFETAAHVANLAAGLVVGKRGTATVTGDELLAELGRGLREPQMQVRAAVSQAMATD